MTKLGRGPNPSAQTRPFLLPLTPPVRAPSNDAGACWVCVCMPALESRSTCTRYSMVRTADGASVAVSSPAGHAQCWFVVLLSPVCDAKHFTWCDGGARPGMHASDGCPVAPTRRAGEDGRPRPGRLVELPLHAALLEDAMERVTSGAPSFKDADVAALLELLRGIDVPTLAWELLCCWDRGPGYGALVRGEVPRRSVGMPDAALRERAARRRISRLTSGFRREYGAMRARLRGSDASRVGPEMELGATAEVSPDVDGRSSSGSHSGSTADGDEDDSSESSSSGDVLSDDGGEHDGARDPSMADAGDGPGVVGPSAGGATQTGESAGEKGVATTQQHARRPRPVARRHAAPVLLPPPSDGSTPRLPPPASPERAAAFLALLERAVQRSRGEFCILRMGLPLPGSRLVPVGDGPHAFATMGVAEWAALPPPTRLHATVVSRVTPSTVGGQLPTPGSAPPLPTTTQAGDEGLRAVWVELQDDWPVRHGA